MAEDRNLEQALSKTLGKTLDAETEWAVEAIEEEYRLLLPDRTLIVRPREGPADSLHWVLSLRADGDIVSKFGPYDSVAALLDQIETVLAADVQYTVCCDG